MKKQKTILNSLFAVVFFGAIWGLLEATIGYLLHWLPGMWSGLVMFPIGAALMYWAYQNTGRRSAIIYVGLIAAAIKAINFAMPLPAEGIMRVYNPMISIILQSLSVFAVSFLFEKKTSPVKQTILHLGVLALAIIAWRGAFLVNQAIQSVISGNLAYQLTSLTRVSEFVLLNGSYEFGIFVVIYGIYRLLAYVIALSKINVKGSNWIMYVLSPLTLSLAVLAVVLL